MELLAYLGLVLLLLMVEGFFSGAETLLVTCDKERVKRLASEGFHGARLLERMLERPERLLAVTLFGAGLALVLNTVLVTLLFLETWGHGALLWVVLMLVPGVLLFGEVLPRAVFERKADQLAPRVAHVLWVASHALAPALWLMTNLHRRLAGEPRPGLENGAGSLRRDDLQQLLQTPHSGSDILAEERRMVDRLMDLSGKTVEEVMVPLVDVVAVPETATREQAIRLMLDKGFSRLLVFREKMVHMVGTLHHFDLLLAPDDDAGIGSLVRPGYFVPETKPVYQLFLFMKKSGNKMAIAVDEYGGATGCITLEDILEEIVGEIEDEYDRSEALVRKIASSSYLVEARSEIGHLNERLSLDLPRGDYETLGGFLLSRMGRIPKQGDVFRLPNLVITVEKASPRAVQTLRMDLVEDPAGRPKSG